MSLKFKTYISDNREYFCYGDDFEIKRDFPFPESLLSMLYFDIWNLEPVFKEIDRALLNLYQSREQQYADVILEDLDKLAAEHIYFELVRLDWRDRLEQACRQNYVDIVDLLPHKVISHIPSNIDTIQKQIKALFANVLDAGGEKKLVSEKMVQYYKRCGSDTLNTFQFQTLQTRFEAVDQKNFVEVLYPGDIYTLIEFSLRECVKREQKVRVCKNCGKYFALTGRTNAEYCGRVFDDKGRTCRDVGAFHLWERKQKDDEVFVAYRREYKRRFAWIKAQRILPEDFYAWSERAREKKAECERGEISLEEFSEWLKHP